MSETLDSESLSARVFTDEKAQIEATARAAEMTTQDFVRTRLGLRPYSAESIRRRNARREQGMEREAA